MSDERSLDASAVEQDAIVEGLAAYTWDAVFERVERIWRQLLD